MEIKTINTDRAPQAIGPYSQSVVAGGLVFCSGQIGLDPATGELVAGAAAAQARQVLANLRGVLEASGSGLERVVKTTVFLVDLADFNDITTVYDEYFGNYRPARSTVEVSRLPRDARVEIEAIALQRCRDGA